MFKTIIISFVLLLFVALISIFIAGGAYIPSSYLEPWDKDYYTKYDDPRTQIIAHGILASNGHNMQNWKFKYDVNNDNAFDMYIETERLATEVDPYHSQATISQGTLFEYMILAGKKLGYHLKVELFPDGEYSQTVSINELKQTRVARVELEEIEKEQDELYAEMFKPDTSRVAYKKDSVSQEDVEILKALNIYQDIRIIYIGQGDKYEKIKNYVIGSVEIETGVEGIMQESGTLFRANEKQKNKYRYGFSFEGSAVTGFKMHLLQGLLTFFPGMNNLETSKNNFMAQTKLAAEKNSGFFLIVSQGNTRHQQFNSGQLYSAMQLKAHTLGLAVQPLSQAIEEYPEMKDVYHAIHQDMVLEKETILILFRIGEPVSEVPKSMRKDVEDFISVSESL